MTLSRSVTHISQALMLLAALVLTVALHAAPVFAAAPTVQATTPASGGLMLVEAKTEVHKQRSATSPVVAVLAPGEHIQTAFAREGWLAVFRRNNPATNEADALGYVPEGMVRPLPPQSTRPAKSAARPAKAEGKPEGKSTPAPELKSDVKGGGSLISGDKPMLNKQDPVRITSDKLTYSQTTNAVVFVGNVHATHGAMALWSDRVTAFFPDKSKSKAKQGAEKDSSDFSDKIERIVAEGNVRMVANKNEGQCSTLTYFVSEGMLRMDGNPVLREGQNTVRGDTIKFYVRENRSEVLSGAKRRVEAIFFTPGENK